MKCARAGIVCVQRGCAVDEGEAATKHSRTAIPR